MGFQFGRFDGVAEAFIDRLPGDSDIDVAVRRLEHAGWYGCWMIIARRNWHFAVF